ERSHRPLPMSTVSGSGSFQPDSGDAFAAAEGVVGAPSGAVANTIRRAGPTGTSSPASAATSPLQAPAQLTRTGDSHSPAGVRTSQRAEALPPSSIAWTGEFSCTEAPWRRAAERKAIVLR